MKNVEGILRDFPDHCQPPEEFEARARQAYDEIDVLLGFMASPSRRPAPSDDVGRARIDGHHG